MWFVESRDVSLVALGARFCRTLIAASGQHVVRSGVFWSNSTKKSLPVVVWVPVIFSQQWAASLKKGMFAWQRWFIFQGR